MATLVFDIKTVGDRWDDLDIATQEALSRWVHRTAKEKDAYDFLMNDLKEGLGLSPLTGKVVAIGLYDTQRKQGAVYYTGTHDEPDAHEGSYIFKQRSEKEMLQDFWEGARSYDTFVTFNGRAFDVPFLLHRSVVHDVMPTCDLMEGRYLYQQKNIRHIDLQDQLTFYGAMHKRPNLHLFCKAYGIESPKIPGVVGDDIAELFAEKKFRDIALYNAHEVEATSQLYDKWLKYLAPDSFRYID